MRSVRGMLRIPVWLLAAGVAGWLVCVMAGWNPYWGQMARAGSICLLSAEAAFVPMWFARRGRPDTVAQAALAGTVLHMILALGMVLTLWMMKLHGRPGPMSYWLLVFYWTSLAAVAREMIGAVRQAAARTLPAAGPGRED